MQHLLAGVIDDSLHVVVVVLGRAISGFDEESSLEDEDEFSLDIFRNGPVAPSRAESSHH
jgi:hypothetical protein